MEANREIVVCQRADLNAGSGVAVLLGSQQVAIFYLPSQEPSVYAIGNYDPCSRANVLSRGIVGDKSGELMVASPIYKQHFSLVTGRCLEESEHAVPVFRVRLQGDDVVLSE